MKDFIDTRRYNPVEAARAAETFGEHAKKPAPQLVRVAQTTATGRPLLPGQHRFPSRNDGVAGFARKSI